MLRGRPDCAMAMRLSRLRAATTLFASLLLQLPIQEVQSLGRLLRASRQRSSAVEKKGREGGQDMPTSCLSPTVETSRGGITSPPLLLGRRCIRHLQLCQLMETPTSTAVKHSIEGSPNAEESFPHRRPLIEHVCATLHPRRPVSVAESSERWPSRRQMETLLCVPPPSPRCILHRTRNFVWKNRCRYRFWRKEQPDGAIAMGARPKRASRRGLISADKLADRGSGAVQVQHQVVAVPRVHCYASNCSFFFFVKIIFLCVSRLPGFVLSKGKHQPLCPSAPLPRVAFPCCQSDM